MLTPYRQFKPADIYIGIDNPQPVGTEDEAGQPTKKINGFRDTGCEFFDVFLNNLYVYGLRTGKFHAKLLGIDSTALSYTIEVLTGMKYVAFTSECTLLMTNDLMKRGNKDLSKLSNRLGFATYSGFFRFYKRHNKKSPTRITRHRFTSEEYQRLISEMRRLSESAEKLN